MLVVASLSAISPIGFHFANLNRFHASGQTFQNASLELGYGPNSLIPASVGIPVFANSDKMWVMSNYNTTVSLDLGCQFNSSLFVVMVGESVQPKTIASIYSFGAASQVYPSCQFVQSWILTVNGSNISA